MIQLPRQTDIEELQLLKQSYSLSIYSPYITPSSANNPNRIQLKNLLKEARHRLSADGLSTREITSLVQPVEKLIDGDEFRVNHRHSLALFVGKNFFQYYRLPADGVPLSMHVNEKFHVQPIIELAADNPPYYVLLLSHNGVQLYKGDYYYIEQIDFQKKPMTMKQELGIDELPNETQTHTVAATDRGKGSERFHGQYNETQVDKDMLVEYFRRIDKKLHTVTKNEKTPLIIAGVDYLLPLYRQVNTYPYLLDDEIEGNIEHTSIESLQEQAAALIEHRRSSMVIENRRNN